MADTPYAAGKDGEEPLPTPLMRAKTPVVGALASHSEIGLVKTVPDGMKPGSDIANLSVMGYDPSKCYTGRSPLEAVSIGIKLKETDLALRCNLVTLGSAADFSGKVMTDYSADEISTEEGHELIDGLAKYFRENGKNLLRNFDENNAGFECFTFYGGVSYRNCLVVSNGVRGTECTPPHDISGKKIGAYLPKGVYGAAFNAMMREAYAFLSAHPVNLKRIERGLRPGNCIWLWGEGRKPALEDFDKLNGKTGAVISAVDLIKGIGIAANMKIYEVEGATGTVNTNFKGKAKAVIDAVKDGCDFVYLHIEAADESGHRGERANKILSIEKIDGVIGYIKDNLDTMDVPYTLLFLPDHPTPLDIRTHTSDPVPYLMYSNVKELSNGIRTYDEISAKDGKYHGSGPELFKRFLEI
jgi:2,3-bisphosphoglycerate-independent phosphoglycerate mutase